MIGAIVRDQRGNPDHLTARVQERASGVSWIDCGIGLNGILNRAVAGAANRTDGGDNAARHRARQPERIADRIYPLADGKAVRFSERRGLQVRRVVDLQQREVVSLVDADDRRLVLVFVGERDLNLLRVVDDVVIGQVVSLLVENGAGALPLLGNRAIKKVE